MNIEKLSSVKMSMMKMESGINKKSKAKYVKNATANFKIPEDFYEALTQKEKEEITSGLVNAIYDDLLKEVSFNDVDSVGLWVEFDGKLYENAIKLSVLNDMQKFGQKDIDPVYEFFKMTLSEVYYSPIAGDE